MYMCTIGWVQDPEKAAISLWFGLGFAFIVISVGLCLTSRCGSLQRENTSSLSLVYQDVPRFGLYGWFGVDSM